jgi:hypothetical protein
VLRLLVEAAVVHVVLGCGEVGGVEQEQVMNLMITTAIGAVRFTALRRNEGSDRRPSRMKASARIRQLL